MFVYEFWGWPSGLDHNSRIRVSSILVLVVQVTTRIRRQRIFFLQVAYCKKGEKSSTDELPTRFAVEFFFVLRVAQVKKPKDFFSDKLHTRARTWKPLSPPGLVCRQKRGKWERKEEDQRRWSVATRRGREKEEKKKTKEGKKVAPAKARFRVPSTKNFFFWFTSIWVWKRPVSLEVSAPTRLSLRGSHVQRKFRKRTTLRSKSSTLKGLLYAGWRSRCEAFVARKGRTIALERSVSKKAVKDKRQSTFFSRVGYPWWFPTWAVLCSLANARKCQLKDFCEKERYESYQSNGHSQQTPSARFRKEKTCL